MPRSGIFRRTVSKRVSTSIRLSFNFSAPAAEPSSTLNYKILTVSIAVSIISLIIGQRYSSNTISSFGVKFVFLLLISPIFRWSIEKYGILCFFIIFCASTVFHVCEAPAIKMIILLSSQIQICYIIFFTYV